MEKLQQKKCIKNFLKNHIKIIKYKNVKKKIKKSTKQEKKKKNLEDEDEAFYLWEYWSVFGHVIGYFIYSSCLLNNQHGSQEI